MVSVEDVFEFADEVLRHFGLMLKVKIQDSPGYSMDWNEIKISKRILECSKERMKYIVAHEVGHRAIPNAPETAANMLLMKNIALNEGIRNVNLFINSVCDPLSDRGNLTGRPWSGDYAIGMKEMLDRAERNIKRRNYHPIYEWLIHIGKAMLAEIEGKPIDFLSGDEYECYVLLFHDPRDWPERCRDLARKLRDMLQETPRRRMTCGRIPFIRPIPWAVDQFEDEKNEISEKEFEEVGKKLARLYPEGIRFIHPRIIRYYRKWRIYGRLIPEMERLKAESKEAKFEGYKKWRIGMPIRELDFKASLSKYGVVIPQVTTLRKYHRKGRHEGRGRDRSGACVIIIDRSGSMAGLRMERAIEAAVGIVEQARRHGDLVSAIAFNHRGYLLSPPCRDYEDVTNRICGLMAGGTTRIHEAFEVLLEQPLDRHATFIITDCGWQDISVAIDDLFSIAERGKIVIFLLGEKPENVDREILDAIRQLNIKIYVHPADKPFTFEAMKEYIA